MIDASAMRRSAANLRLLASIFEGNAIRSPDIRAGAAWDEAMLRLLDAQEALEQAADALEGVWRLPLQGRNAA